MDERRRFQVFLAVAAALFVVTAWLATGTFKVLALSFALAYLLDPIVDWFEARRVPRWAAAVGLLLVALGSITALLALLLPYLWQQGALFLEEAPALAEAALARVAALNLLPPEMTKDVPALLEQLKEMVKERFMAGGVGALGPVAAFLLKATSGVAGIAIAAIQLVVIPILLFFFLRDFDRIREGFFRFVPVTQRERTAEFFKGVDGVLNGFIRGQMLVAASLAVMYSIGLGLSGMRFGILIGVVAGVLFIIPYVGTVAGIAASALVLAVDFSGWGQVAMVAGTFAVAQALEGYVLTPRIVGNRVGLNPLESIVAVLLGGEMGGVAGLFVAIPAVGILKRTVQSLKAEGEGEAEVTGDVK